MNKILFIVFILFSNTLYSQTTLILKPDAVDGKDAHVLDGLPSLNVEPHDEFLVTAWTCLGNPCNSRQLIQFDLNGIPTGATILSAYMNLYANPNPVTIPAANYGTNNECVIRRITSDWQEDTVTWNTQPSSTTVGEIILPHTTTSNQDFLNINVTNLIKDMLSTINYGFFLRLTNENYYNGKNFVTSDHPDASKWPELIITYIDSTTCMELKPNGIDGKDIHILSGLPTTNNDPHPELLAVALTCGGTCTDRSLIDFDLSALPANAILLHAGLNLYANPNPTTIPVANYGTDNACLVQRITSPWQEDVVTWNTQPSVSNQNQVILPHASISNQDYVDVDVTTLVNDMINNPQTSFGFSIQLQNEVYNNGKNFATSDNPDYTKWPSLTLCYKIVQSVNNNTKTFDATAYPNPFTDKIKINLGQYIKGQCSITLSDLSGRILQHLSIKQVATTNSVEFYPNNNISCGIYIITIKTDDAIFEAKITK